MKTVSIVDINCTDILSYEGSVYLSTETLCLHIITLVFGGCAIMSNCLFLLIIYKVPSHTKLALSVYLINVSCINIFLAVGYIIAVGYHLIFPDLNVIFLLLMAFLRYPFQVVPTVLTVCIAWERHKGVFRPFQILTSPPHLARHCISTVALTAMLLIAFTILNISWFTKGLSIFPIVSLVIITMIDISTLIVTVSLYCPGIKKLQEDPGLGQMSGPIKRLHRRRLRIGVLMDSTVYLIFDILLSVTLVLVLSLCLRWKSLQLIFEIQALSFLLHCNITPIINTTFNLEYRKALLKMLPTLQCYRPREGNKTRDKAGRRPVSESTV